MKSAQKLLPDENLRNLTTDAKYMHIWSYDWECGGGASKRQHEPHKAFCAQEPSKHGGTTQILDVTLQLITK
jgi:hypothetical protein